MSCHRFHLQIEAGDVIVKINGTDVHRLTTKEVLKRLRLANEAVELELRRDTKIKSHVNKYLAAPNSPSNTSPSRIAVAYGTKEMKQVRNTMSEPLCRPSRIPTAIGSTKATTNSWSSLPQSPQLQQPKARFEAYMMTGDLILNISKAPRVKGPKVESPVAVTAAAAPTPAEMIAALPKANKISRNGAIAPHAKYDSSTSTSSEEQLSGKSSRSVVKQNSQEARQEQEALLDNEKSPPTSSSPSSSPSANNSSYSNDECPLLRPDDSQQQQPHQQHNSRPKASINTTISVSSAEISYSVPTSPISVTTANTSELKTKETNSAPTSPDSVAQDFVRRQMACNLQTQGQFKAKTRCRLQDVPFGGSAAAGATRRTRNCAN